MKRKTKLEKIQDALLALSEARRQLWKVVDSESPFKNADIKDKLKAIIRLKNVELESLEYTRRAELCFLLSDGATLNEAVDAIHEKYNVSRKKLYSDWQQRDTWGPRGVD
jgi:hypothetical protein